MTIALILLREVLVMAVLVCLGIYTKKSGMLTEDTARRLSDLLVTLIMPVTLINTLQREKKPEMLPGFWAMFFLCLALLILVAAASTVIFRGGDGSDRYQTQRLAMVMPNVGYMGIPLILASTGEDSLIYCGSAIGAFQIMTWCWGITMLEDKKLSVKRLLFNPGILAFLAGTSLFLLEIRLPSVIISFMTQLSSINTPVSMIMIGIFLADVKLKDIFTPSIYKAVFLRNIAVPILVIAVIRVMGLTGYFGRDFSMSAVIIMSCSSAAAVMLLSLRAGKDGGYASRLVALSTFLLIFTMPLIAFIAEKILL